MRNYFVSYHFQKKGGVTGYGSMHLMRAGLIRNWDDILSICELIRKQNKFKAVSVIAWQRFEEPMALIGGGK